MMNLVCEHAEPPRPGALKAPPPAELLLGRRILVVDDEVAIRRVLALILTRVGAVVDAAPSAEAAFQLLLSTRPELLVSDINMPNENGYSLIRRIRALDREAGGLTPAIALTGVSGMAEHRDAIRAGFDAYLTKPIPRGELIATAELLLGPAS